MTATFIAFAGSQMLANGSIRDVAVAVKRFVDEGHAQTPLVFDAETSEPVELDLRGSAEDVASRLPQAADDASHPSVEQPDTAPRRGPGRPKLGVVAREVTLLPRHWEWLATQPGGASVTLRKLVEKARLAGAETDRVRAAQDATYRFMFAVAGNETGFEEASRALYAGDSAVFERETATWHPDVRHHARHLAAPAFGAAEMSRD